MLNFRSGRKVAYNVLHIAEGGEYEALNLIKPQMMIRSNTVQFTTTPPLLAMCCYTSVCFLFFVRGQSLNHYFNYGNKHNLQYRLP